MSTFSYKCPNCSAGLSFDPGCQEFVCEYCGEHISQEQLKSQEEAQQALSSEDHTHEETGTQSSHVHEHVHEAAGQTAEPSDDFDQALYNCPSCGAQVIADATTAATYCFYCHNPIVLTQRLAGEYKPDQVIPFTVTRDEAKNKFLEWAGKKKYLAKGFLDEEQIEKITGVYFPHWMVDSKVKGKMNGRATKVRTWITGDKKYTETKHFQIIREGEIEVSEIIKNALNTEHMELLQSVQPFQTTGVKPFSASYLSGFQAEKRNIEKKELEADVSRDVRAISKQLLRSSVKGYTTVNEGNVSFDNEQAKWKYLLMPVWILTYKGHDDKTYYFAMNGQTGKVNGFLPLNIKKLLMVSGGIAAGIFVLGLLGMAGGLIV